MLTPNHVNVAYYWSGRQWRETPILFSFEWTRNYFREFGRPMVFGVQGNPPTEPPELPAPPSSTTYSVKNPT
jgi:hypothetical protein